MFDARRKSVFLRVLRLGAKACVLRFCGLKSETHAKARFHAFAGDARKSTPLRGVISAAAPVGQVGEAGGLSLPPATSLPLHLTIARMKMKIIRLGTEDDDAPDDRRAI